MNDGLAQQQVLLNEIKRLEALVRDQKQELDRIEQEKSQNEARIAAADLMTLQFREQINSM